MTFFKKEEARKQKTHYLLKFTQKSKKHRTEIVGNDSINYKKT